MSEGTESGPKKCRTCLEESPEVESLYQITEISRKIADLATFLKELTDLECDENDGLPAFICLECVKEISRAVTFKEKCINSDNVLRGRSVAKNTENPSEYQVEPEKKPRESKRKKGTTKTRKKGTKSQSGPPFKCDICCKILSNSGSYRYHMRLHSDETPYLCSQCGEKFKTRNAYDGHMMTHNSNNPHTCNICGKSYRQAASLRCHVLNHTGEKPFLCVLCGKGMTQKSGYKKHMLTHTGDKPHTCDVCHKSFRYSSNLHVHRRSHSDKKPYVCGVS
uniref:Uncharacterized protein n=1 Tax=Phlebotomus papatasi TaxID=29031 RepID=A0A1B0D6A2_PHLPP